MKYLKNIIDANLKNLYILGFSSSKLISPYQHHN